MFDFVSGASVALANVFFIACMVFGIACLLLASALIIDKAVRLVREAFR